MNVADVMDEVAAALATITGLKVHPGPVGSVTPPAAIIGYPGPWTYDETYGRGMDSMALPLVVLVGRPLDVSTRDRLAAYIDGAGAQSVKAAVEGGTYTACDTVRVAGGDTDTYEHAGVPYLAAVFDLDITGSGT